MIKYVCDVCKQETEIRNILKLRVDLLGDCQQDRLLTFNGLTIYPESLVYKMRNTHLCLDCAYRLFYEK